MQPGIGIYIYYSNGEKKYECGVDSSSAHNVQQIVHTMQRDDTDTRRELNYCTLFDQLDICLWCISFSFILTSVHHLGVSLFSSLVGSLWELVHFGALKKGGGLREGWFCS
jgi:hypothetical protein